MSILKVDEKHGHFYQKFNNSQIENHKTNQSNKISKIHYFFPVTQTNCCSFISDWIIDHMASYTCLISASDGNKAFIEIKYSQVKQQIHSRCEHVGPNTIKWKWNTASLTLYTKGVGLNTTVKRPTHSVVLGWILKTGQKWRNLWSFN